MIRKIFLVLLASTMAMGTAACNTVRGAGADLESAANTVDEAT